MTENDEIMTLTQAGEHARVTKQAVYLAIRLGRIKAEKVRSKWMLKKSDLDAYRLSKFNKELRMFNGQRIFNEDTGPYSVPRIAKWLTENTKIRHGVQRVYYLVRTGQIKSCRIGCAWVITEEAAREYATNLLNKNSRQMRCA